MGKYVVLDLEMSHVEKEVRKELYNFGTEIIEIGAVVLDDKYNIEDKFLSYVKPQYSQIDEFIHNLTHISHENTDDAPVFEDALKMFLNWLPEDAILVSWSDTDKHQFVGEMDAKKILNPKMKSYFKTWVDCQKLFSEKMDSPKVYNLTEALNIVGIDYEEGAHDALVDAYNTALLFAKMQRDKDFKPVAYYATEEDSESGYNPFFDLLNNIEI